MFFTKLLCMAALSFAVNSSTNVSSPIGECIVGNISIVPNSTNTAMFNYLSLECENIFNTTNNNTNEQYFLTKYNPTLLVTSSQDTSSSADPGYEKFLLAMKILTPFLCDTFCKGLLKIGCCCSRVECIKHTSEYINHMSESKVLNAGCSIENFLFWTEIGVSLSNLLSIKEGKVWTILSIAPLILWFCVRVGNYIRYAIDYLFLHSSDITRLENLYKYNNDDVQLMRGQIIEERKYLFESLANRGKISKLFANFPVDRMLEAGVQGSFLQNVINNEQNITLRNNMATQLNNALRNVQINRLQEALRVVLREATTHLDMLQNVIAAQHNAGQDAALQILQAAIAHVLQPVHAPVVP